MCIRDRLLPDTLFHLSELQLFPAVVRRYHGRAGLCFDGERLCPSARGLRPVSYTHLLFDPHRSGNLEDPVARILQEPFRYLDPAVVDS